MSIKVHKSSMAVLLSLYLKGHTNEGLWEVLDKGLKQKVVQACIVNRMSSAKIQRFKSSNNGISVEHSYEHFLCSWA